MIGKAASAAAELPLWEAGLGVGVLTAPDYPGADERRTYVLPLPYFVYYGRRLSMDRGGMRSEVLGTGRASFRISASLGLPANSSKNAARAGMPNLDPTIEVGPSLRIRLSDRADRNPLLTLRLPVRTVIATDLSYAHNIGWLFEPHLRLAFKSVGPGANWNLGLSAGVTFATKSYLNYYYGVPPEFATAVRPAFDARGGYSGTGVGLTLTRRVGKIWVGWFARYDDLYGAGFVDSPLVRSSHSFLTGIGFIRVFASSKQPAQSLPDEP